MADLDCSSVAALAPLYVLDALDPAEASAVREHLAGCQQPHPELAELGGVVPYLVESVEPVEPAPQLRERVLAAAAADLRARSRDEVAADRLISAIGAQRPSPRSRGARPADRTPVAIGRWGRSLLDTRVVLGLAAVLVIAILGASAFSFSQQLGTARAYQDQLDRALALAVQPGSRVAIIGARGTAANPSGLAVIPVTGGGVLVMHDLAPLAGTEVYEAWAVMGAAPPAPLGSFTVDADGRGWLGGLAVGAGGSVLLGLTREPGPGATRPTLPMVASGGLVPA